LSKRVFKVKHKNTGEYWQGYGSKFSKIGKEFSSALAAARDISITHIRTDVPGQQLKDLVIIEEVSKVKEKQPLQTIPTEEALAVVEVHDAVRAKYGYSFFCMWHKVVSEKRYEGAKYIVKVKDGDYEDFRESLKGLGFSSRHFSKQKDWLIIYDDDVAMRMKLLDRHEMFVALSEITDD
jgi:hypothetical protein